MTDLTIELNPIEHAYFSLLKLNPCHEFRVSNQGVYASLRDAIAADWQWDAEKVQDHFEEMARAYYANIISDLVTESTQNMQIGAHALPCE